jgi:hypothetical protein
MPSSGPASSPLRDSAVAASWRCDGLRLHDDRGTVAATLDLDAAASGIRLAGCQAAETDALLGIDLGGQARLTDHWIRGGDVTAVYESDDDRRLRTLAMWRLISATAGTQAWVLVLSAQTSLLETMANVGVVSRVRGDLAMHAASGAGRSEFLPGGNGATTTAVLVRLPASAAGPHDALRSLLVAVHPEDRGLLTATASAGRVDIGCRLFPTPLEKGVLLRSRVLAAVGPGANDAAWAAEMLEAFAASPPLLST